MSRMLTPCEHVIYELYITYDVTAILNQRSSTVICYCTNS